ncbi:MAG TPA: alanine dehydrogenase [Cellvibrionaceae bacterium]
MKISVPKEIKNHEYRVGLVPNSVAELTRAGHEVFVETQAGAAIGFDDADYRAAGAQVLSSAAAVFGCAELIVKVKEPQLHECALLQPHQTIFTYLHLAADKTQALALMRSKATCIAYETVTEQQGGLPLLRPMSEVAGRIAVHVGATYLHNAYGGRGVLLGGVPGVAPANVVILGGGVAGINAAQMAVGLHADVTLFDINAHRLVHINQLFNGRVKTAYNSAAALAEAIKSADLVIGAVLIPGAAAPKLISRAQLKTMQPGAVLVDIAIDQGGCFETSHATTHEDPIFILENIIHYCVANMPGAVARTSTLALNNATLPFVLKMANGGILQALSADIHLAAGLNVADGKIIHPAVARALNL